MRTIKFRAWHTRDKEYCIRLTLGNWNLIGLDLSECLAADVIFEQFTGLLDNNGKEIYEGDIVGAFGQKIVNATEMYRETKGDIFNFVVYWDDTFACWGFRHPIASIFPEIHSREIEVIGNIHELKEAKK